AATEIGALDRVVEIAAAAIGFAAARCIGEWQPKSAAVTFEPARGEHCRLTLKHDVNATDTRAAQDTVGAKIDFEFGARDDRLDVRGHSPQRVVRKPVDARPRASALGCDRAVGMIAKQLVACRAKALGRLLRVRVRRGAHRRVMLGHATPPMGEREWVCRSGHWAPLALRAFPPGGSAPSFGRPRGGQMWAPLALRAFPPSGSGPSFGRPRGG